MAFDLDRHSLARTNRTPRSLSPCKTHQTHQNHQNHQNLFQRHPAPRAAHELSDHQISDIGKCGKLRRWYSVTAILPSPQQRRETSVPCSLSLPSLQARAEQGKNFAMLSGLGKTDGREVRRMVHATRSVRSGGLPLIPDFYDACDAVTSRDSYLRSFWND